MPADKRTIGITPENQGALQRLVLNGRFGSELDAARFAMAHAINNEAVAGKTSGTDTKWNVGSVDPDGGIRAVVSAIYPDVDEPYRLIEHLINEGIRDIAGDETKSPDIFKLMFDT